MSDLGASYPLLMLGEPARAEREPLGGGPGGIKPRRPPASEQAQRLGGRWAALQGALESERASLTADLGGVDPELVLVFEIVGSIDGFMNAVRLIDGFEYLAEIDKFGIDEDAFRPDGMDADEAFDGSLYLLATNQGALSAVLQLWNSYQEDEDAAFPHGFARWKELFRLLADVRPWGPQDRLRGTGAVEDFGRRRLLGEQVIPAEIELWYRDDPDVRREALGRVVEAVRAEGGAVVAQATITEIAYQALLIRLPASAVQPILEGRPGDVALIRAGEIAFLRPEAQSLVNFGAPTNVEGSFDRSAPAPTDDPPLVAILDGVPLPTHVGLDGRLVVDDPDGLAAEAPATDRHHGTAIASLVIHGDQGGTSGPPTRRIYMRPILSPVSTSVGVRERIPSNELAIDLVHRAVVRMKDGTNGGSPAAPEVRLVNLSVGDSLNPLITTLSPWARLLDYLANRYDLLFVVSSGNQQGSLAFTQTEPELSALTDEEMRSETLRLLVDSASERRLLSPSEAMSALCVGASHDDDCPTFVTGSRRDLLRGSGTGASALPSPISSIGMGYRRTIKPDLICPGGRVLFRRRPGALTLPAVYDPAPSEIAPGVQVATPGGPPGALDRIRYMQGTSAAAALASHSGSHVLEVLSTLSDPQGSQIDPATWAVLTKALLVHASSLPDCADEVRSHLTGLSPTKVKDGITRLFGYGTLDPSRLLSGTERRATALGWGELEDGEAARFDFPLPPSLSGVAGMRRVTITLAYFPPIRPRNRLHRAAELFFRPDKDSLRIARRDADWQTVKRGTVQHEILIGDRAAAFVDGDTMRVQVNCRAVGGKLDESVPFGLAVTLESEALLPIHAEVAARLQARAQARVQT